MIQHVIEQITSVLPSLEQIQNFGYNCVKTDPDELDPMSILALAALMRFKEPDSKICITNNGQVIAMQPSEYLLGPVNTRGAARRFIHFASREDLEIFESSIRKAAQWYQPHRKENADIQKLFQFVLQGLEPLKTTYADKSGITTGALTNCQNLVKEALEKGLENAPPLDPLAQKVMEVWDSKDIDKANIYLEQMEKNQGDTPIKSEVKCKNEIEQLELLRRQKSEVIRKIFMNAALKDGV